MRRSASGEERGSLSEGRHLLSVPLCARAPPSAALSRQTRILRYSGCSHSRPPASPAAARRSWRPPPASGATAGEPTRAGSAGVVVASDARRDGDNATRVPLSLSHTHPPPPPTHTHTHHHQPINSAVTLSYTTFSLLVYRASGPADSAAQAALDAEVPGWLFAGQAAAFGGVLLLTIFNACVRRSVVHVRGNVMLALIHAVAMSTDVAVAAQWAHVVRGGSAASDAAAARWLPWARPGGGGAGGALLDAAACDPSAGLDADALSSFASPHHSNSDLSLPPILFHPQRYVQWSHTTPTMLLMMSLASDLPLRDLLVCTAADVAMMVTGGFASWCGRTAWGLAWGFASFCAFFPVLRGIWRMLMSAEREAAGGDEQVAAGALRVLRRLTVATWLAFPAVWLLAYAGLVGPLVEQSLWAACDFGAKALFSSHLWQANLLSVQQRRAAARERLETSARALAADRLRALLAERGWLVEALTCDLRSNVNGLLALLAQLSACEASAPPPGAAAAAVAAAAAAAAGAGAKAGGGGGARRLKQQQQQQQKQLEGGGGGDGGGTAGADEHQNNNGAGGQQLQLTARGNGGGGGEEAEDDDDDDDYDGASASTAALATHGDAVAAAATAAAAEAESRDRRLRLIATLRSSAGVLLNAINTTLDSAAAQTGALRLERRAVPLWRSAEGVARLTRPLLAEGVQLVNAIPGEGAEAGGGGGAPSPVSGGAAPPAPPHESWARWRRGSGGPPPASPPASPPAASAPTPPLEVLADPTRLIQVLFTLTGTAARWTRAGRVVLSAEVMPGGREVRVVVADTGAGIPRARFEAVLGSSGSAGGGSDSGQQQQPPPQPQLAHQGDDQGGANALLLVRNCLAAMGSTLVVASVEGRGTRASFVLPLAPPPGGFPPTAEERREVEAQAAAATKQLPAGGEGCKEGSGLRVRRGKGGAAAAPALAAAAAASSNGGESSAPDSAAPDVHSLWATVQALRAEVESLKKKEEGGRRA